MSVTNRTRHQPFNPVIDSPEIGTRAATPTEHQMEHACIFILRVNAHEAREELRSEKFSSYAHSPRSRLLTLYRRCGLASKPAVNDTQASEELQLENFVVQQWYLFETFTATSPWWACFQLRSKSRTYRGCKSYRLEPHRKPDGVRLNPSTGKRPLWPCSEPRNLTIIYPPTAAGLELVAR